MRMKILFGKQVNIYEKYEENVMFLNQLIDDEKKRADEFAKNVSDLLYKIKTLNIALKQANDYKKSDWENFLLERSNNNLIAKYDNRKFTKKRRK